MHSHRDATPDLRSQGLPTEEYTPEGERVAHILPHMASRKAAADAAAAITHRAALEASSKGVAAERVVTTVLDPHTDGASNEGGAVVRYAKTHRVRPFLRC